MPFNSTTDAFYLQPYKGIEAKGNWFRNLKFLGKGGNGTAFVVIGTEGPLRGGIFALKIFHKMSSSERRDRFLREAAFLRTVNHPNLMRLMDEGEYEDRPFVIQDYMPRTLFQEIAGKGLDFGRALIFACQLLSGLQALHKKGIIHRDIKPRNIFVDNLGVSLGDFGLIKKLSTDHDAADQNDLEGYFAMARFYRTPELVGYARKEKALDLRSDIFQLGLVFAEMFSGRNPLIESDDLTASIELESLTHIPGKHAGLVAKTIIEMLNKDPDKRCSIDTALARFTGLVETYSKDYDELHGHSFLGQLAN